MCHRAEVAKDFRCCTTNCVFCNVIGGVNKAQGIDQLSPDPLLSWVGSGHDIPWTSIVQVEWTGLVSEGGMSNGCPMNVHWTGRTIPSGQKILMANLDMCGT